MARKFKTPITIDELGSASSQALAANVDGDSQNRINIDAGGKITWGSGSATGDTTLYRSAANTLKTDDAFTATSLAVTGQFTLPTSDGSADQVITTNGSGTLSWADVAGGATVSDTAPSSPSVGDIWFESDTGDVFVYYDSAWIDIGGTSVANISMSDTAPSSPANGDIWFETDTGKTFVYYDDGSSQQWVEIGAASSSASGSAGAVQFADGNGAFSSDASNLFWDDSNNRLGIGTNAPGYPLEVNGTLAISNESTSLISNNGSSGREILQLRGRTATSDGAGINLYGDGDSSSSAGSILFYSGGSTRMEIQDDGKVGIGTTSPSQILDIEDPLTAIVTINDSGGTVGSTTNSRIQFQAGGSNAGQIGFLNTSSGIMAVRNEDGPLYVETISSDDILFRTNNSTAMTVKADGKIGVRTTAPQTDFELLNGIISVRSSASGTSSVGTDKGIALVAAGMNTSAQFTPGLLFGSNDPQFTTNNPKYNAGIFGRADQTYSADTTTGMSIQMRFAGTNAGTGHGVTGAYGYAFGPTVLHSMVDNVSDLGLSVRRWDDVYATNGTIQTSDERDKTNVTDLTLGLAFVDSLRPVSYTWNDRSGYVGTREHMGFVAQEIATVLGDDAADLAVWTHTESTEETDEEGNTVTTVDRQGLRYNELMAPMVKAVQELSALNTAQQTTIEALEGRIAALEAE